MPRIAPKKTNRKFEIYLAFLTLILFLAFVVTPYFCKMYLGERVDTVLGTVLGTKDTKNITKEGVKEQVDRFFLNLLN